MNNETHINGIATLRRIAVNAVSLLTSDVLNKAATFTVYVLVARQLGARSFGQLSLGLMLLYTFQVFASAGLPTLVTREVAKSSNSSGRYFANGSAVAFCASLLCVFALWLFVRASRYAADTSDVILLFGLSILPWSLTTITEAILRARERMHLIALVAIPVNLLKVVATLYLLSTGHGVRSIALVILGSHAAMLVLEWLMLFRYIGLRDVTLDAGFCRAMLRQTWRFLGIDSLIAVWGSISTVLLSWFADETAVGLFGAAWQLLVPVSMTLQSIDNSLFPMMCRRAENDPARIPQLTMLLLEMLAIVAVPGSVLLYFDATPIISLVYGSADFSNSVVVMRILLPVLMLQAVSQAFGQVLYSHGQEHVTLRIIVIDVIFNVICGTIFIYAFGLIGAAVSLLMTWILNTFLHYLATREWLSKEAGQAMPWNTTLLWKIMLAGFVMAAGQASSGPLNFVVASVLTSCLYLVVLAGLIYVACSGLAGIRTRFLEPLREH